MNDELQATLNKGLNLYKQGMQRLIRDRLEKVFGSEWWKRGVVDVVYEDMRRSILSDVREHPRSDPAEHLDPKRIKAVVLGNFDPVFRSVFHDKAGSTGKLQMVVTARGAVQKDFENVDESMGLAWLEIMRELLSAAGAPEASEVAALHRNVLMRMRAAQPPSAESSAPGSTPGSTEGRPSTSVAGRCATCGREAEQLSTGVPPFVCKQCFNREWHDIVGTCDRCGATNVGRLRHATSHPCKWCYRHGKRPPQEERRRY